MESVLSANKAATVRIFKHGRSSKAFRDLAYWTGLFPYEIYVIPGMFLAMLQMVWSGDITPVRFHILPHMFAFSFFQLLKSKVPRERPGCSIRAMKGVINPGHCKGSTLSQSFPSGHTGIAFALLTALLMELFVTPQPVLFGVPVPPHMIWPIASVGIVVAVMVGMHRIVGGYHYLGDVLTGGALGAIIGMLTWNVLAPEYRTNESWPIPLWAQVIISLPILFLSYLFFSKDVHKLTSIKH